MVRECTSLVDCASPVRVALNALIGNDREKFCGLVFHSKLQWKQGEKKEKIAGKVI
jgi:hypothetical protein